MLLRIGKQTNKSAFHISTYKETISRQNLHDMEHVTDIYKTCYKTYCSSFTCNKISQSYYNNNNNEVRNLDF